MVEKLSTAICIWLLTLLSIGCVARPGSTAATDTPSAPSPPPNAIEVAGTNANIPDIVEAIVPSVVHIQVNGIELDELNQPVPTAKVGTGIILDKRGYIASNEHVINGASKVWVELSDDRVFEAQVIGGDPLTDLGILKIDAGDLTPIPIGSSSDLRTGDPVVAVGHALDLPGGPSVTSGVVSAFRSRITSADKNTTLRHLIQTDASINPGNSGGPLLNTQGEMVGINTSTIGNAQGISFAIAIDPIRPLIEELISQKRIERGFLGIVGVSVNEVLSMNLGLPQTSGVSVVAIIADSPADRAGLMVGDIIVRIDQEPVTSLADLDKVLAKYRRSAPVVIEFYRGDELRKGNATLGDRPR